nr:MobA/MobL family protein [Bifidobacterium sp. A24]
MYARCCPSGAPGEYLDPERLFNAVEMAEKRSDARPAKKIMVALPREFDARERFRALEDFISWNITANGYACTYAIHTDKDGRNPHAHILVANRRIDPKTGRWAAKSRSEFALDANGRRIPVIDPDTGRQKIGARNRKVWKRVNVSNNPLDSKEFLERLRREWADSCNALFPGYAVIDHRSFKARGIERIPTSTRDTPAARWRNAAAGATCARRTGASRP